jgi:hypothetical protein
VPTIKADNMSRVKRPAEWQVVNGWGVFPEVGGVVNLTFMQSTASDAFVAWVHYACSHTVPYAPACSK